MDDQLLDLSVTLEPAVAGDSSLLLDHWTNQVVVPACGSFVLRLVIGDARVGALTVSVNSPDEPGALPELDYENNQVTLEKAE